MRPPGSGSFPAMFQPIIQALPLTQLNNALRAVVLEGAPLPSQWPSMLFLSRIAAGWFALALKWLRWR